MNDKEIPAVEAVEDKLVDEVAPRLMDRADGAVKSPAKSASWGMPLVRGCRGWECVQARTGALVMGFPVWKRSVISVR